MTQPLFPCTIGTKSRSAKFLTIKIVVRNGHTGSRCLHKAVLPQKGGGGFFKVVFFGASGAVDFLSK